MEVFGEKGDRSFTLALLIHKGVPTYPQFGQGSAWYEPEQTLMLRRIYPNTQAFTVSAE